MNTDKTKATRKPGYVLGLEFCSDGLVPAVDASQFAAGMIIQAVLVGVASTKIKFNPAGK